MEKVNGRFSIRLDSFDFIQAVGTDFLGLVTHQICAAIWTRIMKRQYPELIEETLLNVRGETLKRSEEKAIKRIFRIITSSKLTGSGTHSNELGGGFYVEGKVSNTNKLVNERKPLAPFEFLHLLDELNEIIQNYGMSSCNHYFPMQNFENILSNKSSDVIAPVISPR